MSAVTALKTVLLPMPAPPVIRTMRGRDVSPRNTSRHARTSDSRPVGPTDSGPMRPTMAGASMVGPGSRRIVATFMDD